MSDFTMAYHLKTNSKEDAIDLLERSGLRGYVFEETNGWVTFVIEGGMNDQIVSVNQGILLHFTRTSDFLGWGVIIYEKEEELGGFSIAEMAEHRENTLTPELLEKVTDPATAQEILKIVEASTLNEDGDTEAEWKCAEKLGLSNIEWISFEQVEGDLENYEVTPVNV